MAETPPRQQQALVVDDDAGVRTVVAWQLEADGFAVTQVGDGVAAVAALAALGEQDALDMVVLDLSLPGLGGLDVLRRIRDGATAARSDLPVIVLSGRSGQTDRIVGLDQGADDYLVKPFSPGELAARVRSVLRRSRPGATGTTPIAAGVLHIDPSTRDVRVAGRSVELTAKEFDLLAFLAGHPRHVFSRDQLLARVWQSSSSWQGPATVTEHVHRLRHKIEDDPSHPQLLRTVRGVGYQFDPSALEAAVSGSESVGASADGRSRS